MTGRDLADKLDYIGMERGIRYLALKEKMAKPEEIAVMSEIEVCNLVVKEYTVLCAEPENIWLVKHDDLEQVKSLLKKISR